MPHSSRAFCVSSMLVDFYIGYNQSSSALKFGQVENWFTSYDRVQWICSRLVTVYAAWLIAGLNVLRLFTTSFLPQNIIFLFDCNLFEINISYGFNLKICKAYCQPAGWLPWRAHAMRRSCGRECNGWSRRRSFVAGTVQESVWENELLWLRLSSS